MEICSLCRAPSGSVFPLGGQEVEGEAVGAAGFGFLQLPGARPERCQAADTMLRVMDVSLEWPSGSVPGSLSPLPLLSFPWRKGKVMTSAEAVPAWAWSQRTTP